ncbi:M16 family metallopeptidase [Streptomyces goshikiensis]|uniref:M16 family metallopeptidase n=1 Tax=Streptomyces goshikiensis TaxID=1942 RepID=UPI002ADF0F7E|nr:pitrilysin family protein [Streptomyces goshikiensis]
MTEQLLTQNVPVLVDHTPGSRTTTVCVAVGSGARHDPEGVAGATHMLEHLVMSCPLDGGPSLSERVERLGGTCNALTSPELLVIHAQVLNEDAPEVIGWIGASLLRPELTAAHLDRERQVVLQELSAAASDPADAVQDAFLARLFDGHPLGSPVGGDPESIARITVDVMRDAHRQALAGAPVAVSAVGGLPATELLAALDKAGIGALPAAPPLGARPPHTPPPVRTGIPERWPDEFCWLQAGSRAPHLGDPRRHAYNVLGHLMGSSPASLLYARIRNDEALAYSFQSWSRSYSDTGAWRMLAGAEPANAPRVLDAFRSLLAEIASDGPGEEAFSAAVRQAVVEVVLRAESQQEAAIALAVDLALAAEVTLPEQEIEALGRVTAAEVAAAAADVARELVAVVRPEAA